MGSYEVYVVGVLRRLCRRLGRTAARRSRIIDMGMLLHGEAVAVRCVAQPGMGTWSYVVHKAGGTGGSR
ncbi:hypothetical protein GCM10010230_50270 [Streptomyces narbonensis]|nr:hypothetical protein GCM10010230_50270 [Streptomyces narbonensis]